MEYNDPRLEYARKLADKCEPDVEVDENGEVIHYESAAFKDFYAHLEQMESQSRSRYQQYLENDDIIATLEGYELDVETFWYAILFVAYLVERRCAHVQTLEPSMISQMEAFYETIGRPHAEVTISGEKSALGHRGMEGLQEAVREWIEKRKASKDPYCQEAGILRLTDPFDERLSGSVQVAFAAQLFQELFKLLYLPQKRTKHNTKGDREQVSFNKKLLISRVVHLMRLTRNDSFLIDENALKAILKDYGNKRENKASW